MGVCQYPGRKKIKKNMENSRIYVGNLGYEITDQQLIELFDDYGTARIIKHNPERGWAFLEFDSPKEAQEAIAGLQNTEFEGRPLKLDMARPFVPKNRRES
jgi:RNA recognition motif-containing protein